VGASAVCAVCVQNGRAKRAGLNCKAITTLVIASVALGTAILHTHNDKPALTNGWKRPSRFDFYDYDQSVSIFAKMASKMIKVFNTIEAMTRPNDLYLEKIGDALRM
jgi:hypothetical protein